MKVYIDTPELAEKEYSHYSFFKDLPFIPSLHHVIFPKDSIQRLLSYRFIDGFNLHQQFTSARKDGHFLDPAVVYEVLEQISEMAKALPREGSAWMPRIPWSLKSPIRAGFLQHEHETAFMHVYETVLEKNQQAIKLFPGYYFDRNPRNIMLNQQGIWQVDFGVIERSSMLFDLAKLLRNGTDLELPDSVNMNDRQLWQQLSSYPLIAEEDFVETAYHLVIDGNPEGRNLRSKFTLFFEYATVHTHFFYLTKYSKIYKAKSGESKELLSRIVYHFGALEHSIDKLIQAGERIHSLRDWVDRLADVTIRL